MTPLQHQPHLFWAGSFTLSEQFDAFKVADVFEAGFHEFLCFLDRFCSGRVVVVGFIVYELCVEKCVLDTRASAKILFSLPTDP